jgi:hypothetical protein
MTISNKTDIPYARTCKTRPKDKNFPGIITRVANESVVKIMEIQEYHEHLSSIACDAGQQYKMGVPEMLPSVREVLPSARFWVWCINFKSRPF